MKTIMINCRDDLNNLRVGEDCFLTIICSPWIDSYIIHDAYSIHVALKNDFSYLIPWEIDADLNNNTFVFKNNKAFQKLTGYQIVWAPWNENGVISRAVYED